ncbi:hypothetical protein THASP1DRAFT_29061 [Thamnocephalis sphaerospora]|uniref:Uncharacterized protein n=1 Tax=Thamnocephalis sphaerospora TaxID=78915 RepID=A0A4V1IWY1_9FUNG|nr:hypothetical protein THASP1DRAFT_29061 [Thamnocephalis sphaerospora]|eukprot:RKP09139.1 hypothetical protein THASP1DRAFT_29061 [Thamnocephalis sphaerospora]
MSSWGNLGRDTLLAENWEANATRQWGIPLHPLGELDAVSYVMQAQGNIMEMRTRTRGVFIQLLVNTLLAYMFAHNFTLAMRMAYRRPCILAGWYCLLQAVTGLLYTITVMLYAVSGGLSCRHGLWILGIEVAISSICINIALLQKAYLVHNHSKWLLVTGVILLLPQPLVVYFFWTSPAIMVPVVACLSYYPSYFPWIKLALDAPINVLFSVAFLVAVYRQHRLFGSAAWARLVSNGIQTMCIVVVSNIACMLAAVLEVFGLFSVIFMPLNWAITSMLLVHHCTSMRVASAGSHTPRTENAIQGFLQIKTVTSDLACSPVAFSCPEQHTPLGRSVGETGRRCVE